MRRRGPGRLAAALLAVWCGAGVLTTLERPDAAAAAPAVHAAGVRLPAAPPKPANGFKHGSHLPSDWQQLGAAAQAALCAACHVYEAGAPLGLRAITPNGCAGCHFNDPATGGTADLLRFRPPERRRDGPLFDHSSQGHREQSCAECHPGRPAASNGAKYPDVAFDVPRTLAVCASCHGHRADDPARQQMLTTGDGQACDTCHRRQDPVLLDPARRGARRPFRHDSHLTLAQLQARGESKACLECHDQSAEEQRVSKDGELLDAAVVAARIREQACAACHLDRDGATTVERLPDRERQRPPSRFLHSVHKGQVDNDGCVRCHATVAGAPHPGVSWHYDNCLECHATRAVPGHGTFERCMSCHSEPVGRDKVTRAQVARPPSDAAFTLAGQQHPAITHHHADPAADRRACAECHRQRKAALRPRPPRSFRHEVHLGQDRSNGACLRCHATVADSRTAEETSPFAVTTLREADTCTQTCHAGASLGWEVEPVTTSVPQFSHASHLRDGGLSCAQCHGDDAEPRDLRGADLQFCAQCHGHDEAQPEKLARTGPNGQGGGAARSECGYCHVRRGGEFVTAPVASVAPQFALVGGSQFHDKSGACSTCHRYDEGLDHGAVYALVEIERRESLHQTGGPRGDGYALEELPQSPRGGPDCRACHRRIETVPEQWR